MTIKTVAQADRQWFLNLLRLFKNVALLPQPGIFPSQPRQVIRSMGPAAFARERGLAMGVEVGLPLIL